MRAAWPLALLALSLAMTVAWLSGIDASRWNWQAGLWRSEPWRLWTCTLVAGSALHLIGNVAGALLLATLGWQARLGARALLALALAWPLGHALLALRPDLPAYFGASGLLHGAAALVGLGLLRGEARERRVGALFLAGLAIKLLAEQPWGPALRLDPLWGGMATVPLAHALGSLAALALGAAAGRRLRLLPA